jgi:hypothetical protein
MISQMTGCLGHALMSFTRSTLHARGGLFECAPLAHFQEPFGVQGPVELDDFCHEPGPAGLVARAESRSVVPVKVFIEQDVVAPVRIGLELFGASINRTPPCLS